MFFRSPLVVLPVAGLIVGAGSCIAVHLITEYPPRRDAEQPQTPARAASDVSRSPADYRLSRNVVITREPRAYAAISDTDWFRCTPPACDTAIGSIVNPESGLSDAPSAASNSSSDVASTAPRNAEHLAVVGTTALGGRTLAYVRDDRDPQAGMQHLRVGDALDNGTIVLIHPRGVVVRCAATNSDAPTDYFYEIGQTFSSRTPLAAAGLSDVDLKATSIKRPVRQ